MTCVQREFFVIISAILIVVHVKQPVNSFQDDTRHHLGWSNRLRHRHTPEKYIKKQFWSHSSGRSGLSRVKTSLMHQEIYDSINRKLKESSITPLPWGREYLHTTSLPLIDHDVPRLNQGFSRGLSNAKSKSDYLAAPSAALRPAESLSKAPKELSGKEKDDSETLKDEDYYYYYDDRGDSAPAAGSDIIPDADEENAAAAAAGWHRRTAARSGSADAKHDPAAALIDDYTFDYLDDDPTNQLNEKSASLTEDKWRNYGTAEAVETSRRRHMSEAQKVASHITRIHLEAMCKQPRPKIIQMNDASKRYVPHCTMLHRCGDDTGCCHSDIQTCVAKKTEQVELFFYVIPFGSKDAVVEKVSFINHTECHCLDRTRLGNAATVVSTTVDSTTENINSTRNRPSCECVRDFTVFEGKIVDKESDENDFQTSTDCRCDCVSENHDCVRLKRGLEGFPAQDRRCILDGRCREPTCQFGEYSVRLGRCPRSQTKRMIPHSWFD